MARCNSCGLFAGVELSNDFDFEPDIASCDEETVEITGDVRLIQVSNCCEDEVAEATVTFEGTAQMQHEEDCAAVKDGGDLSSVYVIDDQTAEATDRYQNRDRHGKPIKSIRYMRHFYGADISVLVKCGTCNGTGEAEGLVEEQASYFESLW